MQDELKTLPKRPPGVVPGLPAYRHIFYIEQPRYSPQEQRFGCEAGLIITGDIGCYTLASYPPLNAMDTCACMGAGIGQALGMEKAGGQG